VKEGREAAKRFSSLGAAWNYTSVRRLLWVVCRWGPSGSKDIEDIA
jgi:hypothetical protein